ncbi:tryptophan-rich sensory protein [Rhizobium leguminosarum]
MLVLGVGLLIGFTIRPGEWYSSLNKPFFNPPNWVSLRPGQSSMFLSPRLHGEHE